MSDKWFGDAFGEAERRAGLTDAQRDGIRERVLASSRLQAAGENRLARWLLDCPWRAAFGLAAAQCAVCLAAFGQSYIDFVMKLVRGGAI